MTGAVLVTTDLRESAQVENWGERLMWTAVVVAVIVLLWGLMWRGWRSRAGRQRDVPALPAAPSALGAVHADGDGIYVSTTTAGDWLDRIVVHGLGARSAARMVVADTGVLFERTGAPDVFVPARALVGVRLQRGMAGKFVEEEGLIVLTWHHGERDLDTGFRPRRAADRDELVGGVERLLSPAGGAR